MSSNTTYIELTDGGVTRSFSVEKAEWLLSFRSGWSLPVDSRWVYTDSRIKRKPTIKTQKANADD